MSVLHNCGMAGNRTGLHQRHNTSRRSENVIHKVYQYTKPEVQATQFHYKYINPAVNAVYLSLHACILDVSSRKTDYITVQR